MKNDKKNKTPSSPLPDWFRPTVVDENPSGRVKSLMEEDSKRGMEGWAERSKNRSLDMDSFGEGEEDLATTVWEGRGVHGLLDGSNKSLGDNKSSDKGPQRSSDKDLVGGRYRIISGLATGGMARVLKVEHVRLGKEFALKVVADNLSGDRTVRERFFREARLTSLLDHPNIVSVVDFGIDGKLGAYLLMEYLKGESLSDRLMHQGPLKVARALDVALQTAEALHYMHSKEIVHCDIKADNVFLCRPPKDRRQRVSVKLIDFGLSGVVAKGATLARCEVGGTPRYIAPEQIRRSAPQPSMDIYSLGVLIYEMITGKCPFKGTAKELLQDHLNKKPQPPSHWMKEKLDPAVEELVLKSLKKDPKERQASMGQVVYELRTLMDMLGISHDRSRHGVMSKTVDPETLHAVEIFRSCSCPLFRLDSKGNLLAANEAFYSFSNLKPKKIIGRPLQHSKLGRFFKGMEAVITSGISQKSNHLEPLVAKLPKANGGHVYAMMQLTKEKDSKNKEVHLVGIIHPLKRI